MTGIILVFPNPDNAKGIRNILVKSGYSVFGSCESGAQAIAMMDDLGSGIIISGYKLKDMLYTEIRDCMNDNFELLLLASEKTLAGCELQGVVSLSMPLKVHELLSTVEMMVSAAERRRRRKREKPKVRSREETKLIADAKALLMERNHMTEPEAHKYLQKCSMDSSTSIVESAQMVLSMYE